MTSVISWQLGVRNLGVIKIVSLSLNHIINDISAIAQRGDLRVIKILFTKIEVIVISVVYWQ